MLPFRTIDGFLKFTDPGLREIVLELRNIVAQVAPGAAEDIRHGGIVYYFEELGGPVSAGVCGIAIKPDHVRLYFTHGAFISDKTHLLRGSGKAMRYLLLDKFESIPWEEIRDLIAAHADFGPSSFTITWIRKRR